MVDERTILQGLVQRGLPPHVAQGFVMNMRDESGLNPGINEIAPLVPGSRGGFGLYQLTGPRRIAYEQFAANRGVDPANVDAQLDFLVSELQGPESRAARSIFSAQDAPSAAVAIARDFLRPAPENLQRRVAQYTGGTTMQPQGLLSAPTTSAQGQEPQGQPFFQRPRTQDVLDQLIIGLEGMSLRPNQGIVQMAQERIGQRREEQQTQQERNATLEWLAQSGLPNAELLIGGVRAGAITPADAARTGFQLLKTQADASSNPNVQSSTTLPDMSGVVTVMRDGSVRVTTAGGETLSGQAAQDFVAQAQANAAQVARELYGARREGTLEAEVELGGAAAGATEAGKEMITRAFQAYDQVVQAGSAIATMNEAIAAIDAGARSGLIENFLPNVTEASAALNNAMNRMGLDVISSVTFGALSEGEMRLAMETAAPRNLDPQALREWLVAKRDAQEKAREALINAARFLSNPENKLADWLEQQEFQSSSAPPASADMSDEELLDFYRGQ